MIYAIDFDGTIVTHEYPAIGRLVPHAIEVMSKLQERGDKLILLTMRSGRELGEAVSYCKDCGITFWGINNNPEQHEWTNSRKVYANMYIDDAGCLMPLVKNTTGRCRPYVDWVKVSEYLFGV